VKSIRADKKRWVDFMMRFELGLEEPDPRRARNSAITIALSYVDGGMVPLAPYFVTHPVVGLFLAADTDISECGSHGGVLPLVSRRIRRCADKARK